MAIMKFARFLRVDQKLTSRLVHGPVVSEPRVACSPRRQFCTSTGRGGYISIVWQDTLEVCIVSHSQVEEAMSDFAVSTRTRAPTDIVSTTCSLIVPPK